MTVGRLDVRNARMSRVFEHETAPEILRILRDNQAGVIGLRLHRFVPLLQRLGARSGDNGGQHGEIIL